MIYTVVCTDLNDYVNWQVELLEYTWSKSHQVGKLVHLIACDEDQELPDHRHAEVYRTKVVDVPSETGDSYVCYNRLFSLKQWLEEEDIQGTILVVDCDVVFKKIIKTEVARDKPVGQHWIDFGVFANTKEAIKEISDIDPSDLQPVTWPALINADDLRLLLPRWIELTINIREHTKGQESDMYGFLVAAKELGIKFELGEVAAFLPWPDEKVGQAPIIHYCQVVKDVNDQRLWGKWGYQPWDRVENADQAKLKYAQELLSTVDEFARLKNFERTHQDSTIFIAIASYCEPELIDTIQSCLEKARFPENLRFGICHQFDNNDDLTSDTCLDSFSQDARFRYVIYDYRESHGGCWARNVAQQLYDGETYTLQIDAHTQMIESWDTILIEMLESLPSKKPLITTCPPLYSIETDGSKAYQESEDLTQVKTAIVRNWSQGGWLDYVHDLPKNTQLPRANRLLSGGFIFTTGEWNNIVRQDPKFLYVGEELALTLRSFTNGYDLFDPTQNVCWHRLHPKQNRKFRNDNSEEVCQAKHQLAISRLNLLIEGDPEQQLGQFCLGSERTLQDYADITGIDCVNKTVTEAAQLGEPINLNIVYELPLNVSDQDSVGQEELNSIVEVTIYTKSMAPLVLACLEETPVLASLFEALQNKSTNPDDLIYLQLGDNGEETVLIKQKELVSIETSPALSETFFSRLQVNTALTSTSNQQAMSDLQPFNDDWKIWIWDNISRGCTKDSIFKQLIDNGFTWHAVKTELNFEPGVQQNQILAQTPIKSDYQANAIARQIVNSKLEIYQIDDFLNKQECQTLLTMIKQSNSRSKVVGDDGGIVSNARTNSSCSFDEDTDQRNFAADIRTRLCRIIGINPAYAEPIQGQLYEQGEEYKAHYDWFEPGTAGFDVEATDIKGGQRTWSVVVYLNDVEQGGETHFSEANITVYPKVGRVVFWDNLDANRAPSRDALHQACPVLAGQKAILTLWFRSLPVNGVEYDGEMFINEKSDFVPAFTQQGFSKGVIPKQLFKNLSDFYQAFNEQDKRDEFVEGGFLENSSDKLPSHLIDIPDDLRQTIINDFLPICENWSKQKLEFSSLYGIRVYATGTSLKMHTDTISTHIISVILNIGQDLNQDWPLEIVDHMKRIHSVYLKPGEMILYEGARLSHGRPTIFDGKSYANIFLHFCPKGLQL